MIILDNTSYLRLGAYPVADTLKHSDRSREKAIEELHNAIGSAHQILMSATTVFPFTLFPDTITIDRAKVTVAHRFFFGMAEVISIPVKDILNVTADVGPIFGAVNIASRFFDQKEPYAIHYLWRRDALKIKRIMQGYIIAQQKEIDCSALKTKELANMLDELGKGALEN